MREFKVGDFVKQTKPYVYREHSDNTFVVHEIDEKSSWPLSVKIVGDPLIWLFSEDELEFVDKPQLEFKF